MKVRTCKSCPYTKHETGIEYDDEGCLLCGNCPRQGTLRTDTVYPSWKIEGAMRHVAKVRHRERMQRAP